MSEPLPQKEMAFHQRLVSNWPYVRSEWRGIGDKQELWWIINSEEISGRALANWCANNMEGAHNHVDVVRWKHCAAYAEHLEKTRKQQP